MERVAFLIEQTGERISCLLNPEFLEMRRVSGLRTRTEGGGFLAAASRTDHPLIATGGGVTELDLRLLFDTEVARLDRGQGAEPAGGLEGAALAVADVREMTRPIWNLSENASGGGFSAPPCVRFIWGKSWNIPGVIVCIAERLERFDANGLPQRSWLALRMRRVEEPEPRPAPPLPVTPQFEISSLDPWGGREKTGASDEDQHPSVTIPVDDQGVPLNRLDQICAEHYGAAGLAPLLGDFNDLDDLLTLAEGATLSLPPASVLTGVA
jgi:hypothetical protein